MIVSGYYGELYITGDLSMRLNCWFLSMAFFLYIVYELLVGLSQATNSEAVPTIKGNIQLAQVLTVISWCTYPIVYGVVWAVRLESWRQIRDSWRSSPSSVRPETRSSPSSAMS